MANPSHWFVESSRSFPALGITPISPEHPSSHNPSQQSFRKQQQQQQQQTGQQQQPQQLRLQQIQSGVEHAPPPTGLNTLAPGHHQPLCAPPRHTRGLSLPLYELGSNTCATESKESTGGACSSTGFANSPARTSHTAQNGCIGSTSISHGATVATPLRSYTYNAHDPSVYKKSSSSSRVVEKNRCNTNNSHRSIYNNNTSSLSPSPLCNKTASGGAAVATATATATTQAAVTSSTVVFSTPPLAGMPADPLTFTLDDEYELRELDHAETAEAARSKKSLLSDEGTAAAAASSSSAPPTIRPVPPPFALNRATSNNAFRSRRFDELGAAESIDAPAPHHPPGFVTNQSQQQQQQQKQSVVAGPYVMPQSMQHPPISHDNNMGMPSFQSPEMYMQQLSAKQHQQLQQQQQQQVYAGLHAHAFYPDSQWTLLNSADSNRAPYPCAAPQMPYGQSMIVPAYVMPYPTAISQQQQQQQALQPPSTPTTASISATSAPTSTAQAAATNMLSGVNVLGGGPTYSDGTRDVAYATQITAANNNNNNNSNLPLPGLTGLESNTSSHPVGAPQYFIYTAPAVAGGTGSAGGDAAAATALNSMQNMSNYYSFLSPNPMHAAMSGMSLQSLPPLMCPAGGATATGGNAAATQAGGGMYTMASDSASVPAEMMMMTSNAAQQQQQQQYMATGNAQQEPSILYPFVVDSATSASAPGSCYDRPRFLPNIHGAPGNGTGSMVMMAAGGAAAGSGGVHGTSNATAASLTHMFMDNSTNIMANNNKHGNAGVAGGVCHVHPPAKREAEEASGGMSKSAAKYAGSNMGMGSFMNRRVGEPYNGNKNVVSSVMGMTSTNTIGASGHNNNNNNNININNNNSTSNGNSHTGKSQNMSVGRSIGPASHSNKSKLLHSKMTHSSSNNSSNDYSSTNYMYHSHHNSSSNSTTGAITGSTGHNHSMGMLPINFTRDEYHAARHEVQMNECYFNYTSIALPEECSNHGDTEERRRRLEQRYKQVMYGKDTDGYRKYRTVVPRVRDREFHNPMHPMTPRPENDCSKRTFDKYLNSWRRQLHQWDSCDLNAMRPEFMPFGVATVGDLNLVLLTDTPPPEPPVAACVTSQQEEDDDAGKDQTGLRSGGGDATMVTTATTARASATTLESEPSARRTLLHGGGALLHEHTSTPTTTPRTLAHTSNNKNSTDNDNNSATMNSNDLYSLAALPSPFALPLIAPLTLQQQQQKQGLRSALADASADRADEAGVAAMHHPTLGGGEGVVSLSNSSRPNDEVTKRERDVWGCDHGDSLLIPAFCDTGAGGTEEEEEEHQQQRHRQRGRHQHQHQQQQQQHYSALSLFAQHHASQLMPRSVSPHHNNQTNINNSNSMDHNNAMSNNVLRHISSSAATTATTATTTSAALGCRSPSFFFCTNHSSLLTGTMQGGSLARAGRSPSRQRGLEVDARFFSTSPSRADSPVGYVGAEVHEAATAAAVQQQQQQQEQHKTNNSSSSAGQMDATERKSNAKAHTKEGSVTESDPSHHKDHPKSSSSNSSSSNKQHSGRTDSAAVGLRSACSGDHGARSSLRLSTAFVHEHRIDHLDSTRSSGSDCRPPTQSQHGVKKVNSGDGYSGGGGMASNSSISPLADCTMLVADENNKTGNSSRGGKSSGSSSHSSSSSSKSNNNSTRSWASCVQRPPA